MRAGRTRTGRRLAASRAAGLATILLAIGLVALSLSGGAAAQAEGGNGTAAVADATGPTAAAGNESAPAVTTDTAGLTERDDVSASSVEVAPQDTHLGPSISGSVLDDEDQPIEYASIEVATLSGQTIWQIDSLEGDWSVPLSTGRYTVTAEVDGVVVERVVEHDEDGAEVVHRIDRCGEDDDFVTNPGEPAVGEPVSFTLCADLGQDAQAVRWDFDDDSEGGTFGGSFAAPNDSVSHSYDEPGTYTVEATVVANQRPTATYETEIEIEAPELWISDLDAQFTWVDMPIPFGAKTIFAGIENDSEVETVTFTFEDGDDEQVVEVEDEFRYPVVEDEYSFEDDWADTSNYSYPHVDPNGLPPRRQLSWHTEEGVYAADFDRSQFDPNSIVDVTVQVETTDGQYAYDNARLFVAGTPGFMDWFVEGEFSDNVAVGLDGDGPYATYERQFLDFDASDVGLPNQVPLIDSLARARAQANLGFEYYPLTPEFSAAVNGEGQAYAGSYGGILRLGGTGTATPHFGDPWLTFDGATVTMEFILDTTPPIERYELDAIVDEFYLEVGTILGPFVRGEAQLDYDDGMVFEEGAFEAGVTLEPVVEAGVPGANVRASGDAEVYFRIETDLATIELAYIRGHGLIEVSVEGPGFECDVELGLGFRVLGDEYVDGSFDYGCSETVTDSLASLAPWAHGHALAASTGPLTQQQRVATFARDPTTDTKVERVTTRVPDDSDPALAAVGDEQTVVWNAQQPSEEVADEYIYGISAATRGPDGWSERTDLTDGDERAHYDPAVAAGPDDDLAAVWTTIDADPHEIDSIEEAAPHYEVSLATSDDDGWSEADLLTDSDAIDRHPTVAGTDDGWVVAWERRAGVNDTDVHVEYAVLDANGSVETTGQFENASRPALGSDGDVVDVAYRDDEAEQYVHERLEVADQGAPDRSLVGTYEYAQPNHLTAGDGAIAWVNRTFTDPTIRYAEDGSAEELEIRENYTSASELELIDTDRGTGLVYQAHHEDEQTRDVVYRLRQDDTWIYDRSVAATPDDELAIAGTSTVPVDDGFATAFAAVEVGEENHELFHLEHEFGPDYAVEDVTAPENVSVGDEVSLEATVANVGDTPVTESVPVTVGSDGTTYETVDVPALDAGENHTVVVNATVDQSGTATVRVDPEEELDQLSRANDDHTHVFLEPDLAVEEPDPPALADDGAAAVYDVPVENVGPIPATNVSVGVEQATENGTTVLNATTVEHLAPGENATVAVRFDTDDVDPDVDTLVAATDGTGSAHDSRTVMPLTPNLQISGVEAYRALADETVADVTVANTGLGSGNATLRVIDPGASGDDRVLEETRVEVPGLGSNETTQRDVRVPIDPLGRDDDIRLALDVDGMDLDSTTLLYEETIPSVVPVTGTVEVTAVDVDGQPVSDATVLVGDQGDVTDEAGTVTVEAPAGDTQLTAEADGYDRATTTVTIPDGDVVEETIVLPPEGPSVVDYANDDGIVDVDGLLEAIDDFRANAIGVDLLLDVIDAFRSDDPVV